MLQEQEPRRKPKSLLETHQDNDVLVQALYEFAASQQQDSVSRDMTSDLHCSSSSPASMRLFFKQSTSPKHSPPPERIPEKPVSKPLVRRKLATSEQPSIPKLTELGVKVRDFAFEKTDLPPVKNVYRQPRQIISHFDSNVDPNDPYYLRIEAERKKKVYTIDPSQKLERRPTEPIDLDVPPPPPRTFPPRKQIQRQNAELDLSSQPPESQPFEFQSQSQSQSQSQTPILEVEPTIANSQQTDETWIDTPLVTPNGSLVWRVRDSDSQAPPEHKLQSYSQTLGLGNSVSQPQLPAQLPSQDGRAIPSAHQNHSSSDGFSASLSPVRGGVAVSASSNPTTLRPLYHHSGNSTLGASSVNKLQQERISSPVTPVAQSEAVATPIPSPVSTSPRYALRSNKRTAETIPTTSIHRTLRPRLVKPVASLSAKAAHSKDKRNMKGSPLRTTRSKKRKRSQ